MTPEEYTKALAMLHPLDGLALYLDLLKDQVKAIDTRRKGDMLLCVQAAERIRRQTLSILQDLLRESSRVEGERQERGETLTSQARAQGRAEALDRLAEIVAELRQKPEPSPPEVMTRTKKNARRRRVGPSGGGTACG